MTVTWEDRERQEFVVLMHVATIWPPDSILPHHIWHPVATLRAESEEIADALADGLYGPHAVPFYRSEYPEYYRQAQAQDIRAEHAARVAQFDGSVSRFVQQVRAAILRRNNGQ